MPGAFDIANRDNDNGKEQTVPYCFTEQGIEIGPLDPSHKIRRGNIFLFDFNKPDEGAQALTIVGELDRAVFSPHGLSIWSDNDRSKFLRSRDPVLILVDTGSHVELLC